MRYFVTIGGTDHAVDLVEKPSGGFDVEVSAGDGAPRRLAADVIECGDGLSVKLGDRMVDLVVDGRGPTVDVFASGKRSSLQVESARSRAAAALGGRSAGGGTGVAVSPMHGRVVKVLVAAGDTVAVGTPLVVVEAMKMENEIASERAGVVETVHVAPGDAVEGGQKLVTVA